MATDTVLWGFKAIKPFDAEHPIGSGIMVHYDPGDEVPASEWGRAEGFMVEAGSIMRYAVNVAQVPGQIVSPPIAEESVSENEEPPVAEAPDGSSFPVKQDGPNYLLSDGSIVRGKQAALAAQAELDVAAESTADESVAE